MIRNIVFDMGEVLLHYDPMKTCNRLASTPQEAQAVFRALFRAPEWEKEYDGGMISEEDMLRIAQSRLSSPARREAARHIFAEYHQDALSPFPGMEQVMLELRRRGFGLYLLSNTSERFHRFKHLIPQIEAMDGILLSCEEKLLKPDARIFWLLHSRFGLELSECLFVDDRLVNVEGAQAVGMEGYCFADGDVQRLAQMLRALANPD